MYNGSSLTLNMYGGNSVEVSRQLSDSNSQYGGEFATL